MTTPIDDLISDRIELTVPDASSIDQLTAILGQRLWHSGRGVAALRALAILDPRAAAHWLLDDERMTTIAAARVSIAGVIESISQALVATPDLLARDASVQLIGRYGHLLSAESALEVTSALREESADSALEQAVTRALQRAPSSAGLLRAGAEIAIAREEPAHAHDLLTRLGRADRTAATMRFIASARRNLPATSETDIRIAILSSFTIDTLLPYVDLECRSLRVEPKLYLSPFNTWPREMLGEGSALQQFGPQLAFLAVAADDLIPELSGAPSADDLTAAGVAAVDRILAAAEQFLSWSSSILVVHSLHSAFRDPMGPAAGRADRGRAEVLADLNARLANGLRRLPRAHLLDVGDVLGRRRQGALDNPKMRHLASMRLSEDALAELAGAYAQFVAPVAGRTRKCVVLDLDNTLWGGIVGEDGPHGIRLGTASPGSEYREFQLFLQSLAQRGLLLALNSKNNADDALEVIRGHESMVLREDAFSAIRINWESKPNNLLSIAEELSLGLDSFVFIDDNEKERALMRQTLPQVLTPDLPSDPALYREVLEHLPELHVLNVTEEDRSRTRLYIERRQRESLRVSAQTIDEYLRSLEIVVLTEEANERTLTRVHQLFQRTNQFNLAGRRYELGTLSARTGAPEWRVYATRVSDRFGDHGLVAAAVVHAASESWTIENLVMSCRVIGYGVEDALLARIARDARGVGVRRVVGEFIASAKNAPAKEFYSRNEFVRDTQEGALQRWERGLGTEPLAAPAWIQEAVTHGA